ncbi:MAG: amino acid transporter [Cyclobacteriaceae bacterium]|jgi:amino acid transporter
MTSQPSLERSLTLRDLVLQNIAGIVGFSTLALSSQFGWASLTLIVLGFVLFVVPAIIMVMDLSLRMPSEGGLYLWTKTAFGEKHGFVAAWSYWVSNLVWFPSVLFAAASLATYIFLPQTNTVKDESTYTLVFSLCVLWSSVLLNIWGLRRSKWIQNIGGIAVWITILFLVVLGLFYVGQFGHTIQIDPAAFIPDFTDFSVLPFFAAITFAWAGIELTPVMSGEIIQPKKTIPKALFIAAIIILTIYLLGSAILVLSIPAGEIDLITGLQQAYFLMSSRLGIPWMGKVGAGLMTISTIGLFGAWLTGNARIPFVIGLDNYLPKSLGKIHPKWKSPYISLLSQGVLISFLLVIASAGTSVKDAFVTLTEMSIILFFIPFIYMFLALYRHNKRGSGEAGLPLLKGRKKLINCIVISGLVLTGLSIVLATLPPGQIEQPSIYLLKVVGGCLFLILAGFVFYFRKQARASDD